MKGEIIMKVNAVETRQISVDVDPKDALRAIADYLHIPVPRSLVDVDIYWEAEYENNIPVRICCYQKDKTGKEQLMHVLTRATHQIVIDRFAAVDELAKLL